MKVSFSKRDMSDDSRWENRITAIDREADAILAAEGAFRVKGVDYASADDATTARMYLAEERVKAKARQQIEVEAIKAQGQQRIQALFAESPNCDVCGLAIPSLDRATVFTPIGGKDRLIHDDGTCFGAMIERSIGKYQGRGRGTVIEMAVTEGAE